MAQLELVHALVSQLLGEWFNLDDVRRDDDGDYPFRHGSTVYYVRVVDREPAVLRIFSVAVNEVDATPELLAELNDVNAHVSFARVSHASRQVWVETELWPDAMDAFSLGMACERVGELSDRIGPPLAAIHGGRTRFQFDEPEGEGPQED